MNLDLSLCKARAPNFALIPLNFTLPQHQPTYKYPLRSLSSLEMAAHVLFGLASIATTVAPQNV